MYIYINISSNFNKRKVLAKKNTDELKIKKRLALSFLYIY